jgi:NAD(P) transhydrogenase subunit alpha
VIVGVPCESTARETRVAATPATVAKLVALGYEAVVESGAGEASSFPDDAYAAACATVGPADEGWQADVVLRVNAPGDQELARLRDGAALISRLGPGLNPHLVDALASRPLTALAMEDILVALPKPARKHADVSTR